MKKKRRIPVEHFGSNVPTGHSVYSVRTAFSLIEIVLALGIISFALVGIMGLFPVALKSALESQRETRAAYIARQLFSDLSTNPAFVASGTNISLSGQRIPVDLTTSGTYTIYLDRDGFPTGTAPGTDDIYRAVITVSADSPSPGITHIRAAIFTPAATTVANPSEYTFVTLKKEPS